MNRYHDAIETCAANTRLSLPLRGAMERFINTGDEASLKSLVAAKDSIYPHGFHEVIPPPGQFDATDERAVRFLIAIKRGEQLLGWLNRMLGESPPEAGVFDAIAAKLRSAGATEADVDGMAVQSLCRHPRPPVPDSAGRHVLSLDDATLTSLVNEDNYVGLEGLIILLARRAPDRVKPLLPALSKEMGEGSVAHTLLETAPQRFEPFAADVFRRTDDPSEKFTMGRVLLRHDAAKYGPELAQSAEIILEHSYGSEAMWLLPTLGPAVVEAVARRVAGWYDQIQRQIVELIPQHGGEKAGAALLIVVNGEAVPQVRAMALERLIDLKDPAMAPHIEAALYKAMEGEPRMAAKFASAAARSGIAELRERLWSDVAGKKKIPRAAAAEAVAANDPGALDRAAAMLAERSKDARWGATLVLAHLATPQSADVLLNRVARETDEEVRHEMTKAIRAAGVGLDAIVKALGPTDLNKLRERGRGMKTMPAKWLADGELPELKMHDGAALDADLVRFLLNRQAWQGEPVPDPEAAPLYMLIDRRTSGEFAWKLLNAFLESDRGKADAWALIAAGMLGDNRVITTLTSKIRGWADAFDQKLGEFGIEALALNGSEAALMAVQSIAEKYRDNPRRKYNVIGTAAQEALELAAKRMGISMDELGDRIVPALGFEPGRSRVIEAGGRTIEATIGLDFKLSMKDVKTGKNAATIPKAAPPEVQAEFKGLGKLLTEAAKSQSARLEALMVRQHRWPAPRWEEVFLRHPLLFPFAVRLVWGAYAADGALASTFRTLPDRTLTDAHDESVELNRSLAVGIVHPLDLTREQIDMWTSHLSDYEIEPPFMQIERRIVAVPAELRDATKYEVLAGTKMNAMSFRSRAERSGWTRGPSGDAGMIASFRKRFVGSRIDAFVVADGVPGYGYDPSAMVTLGQVLFLPLDTKPADFAANLMRLDNVPAMVFSETVGDLVGITGKSETSADAEAGDQDMPATSQSV